MCYTQNNKELHSLPIVDRPENMILLGSVNRHDLVRMIERHIGRKRRLEVAAKWRREAKKRAREEADRRIQMEAEEQCRARRPSRFEVIPAPDVQKLRELANNEMLPPQAKKTKETINNNASLHSLPAKSILKKTNSFNSQKGSSPYPLSAGYSTISGTDSRIRSALEAILRKSATLQDITPGLEGNSVGYAQTITGSSPSISKRVQLVYFIFIRTKKNIKTHVCKTDYIVDSHPKESLICHWRNRKFGSIMKCRRPLICMRLMCTSIHRLFNWSNAHRCLKCIACSRCWVSIMPM